MMVFLIFFLKPRSRSIYIKKSKSFSKHKKKKQEPRAKLVLKTEHTTHTHRINYGHEMVSVLKMYKYYIQLSLIIANTKYLIFFNASSSALTIHQPPLDILAHTQNLNFLYEAHSHQ